jgi:NitT/TauT family transport system substrate-binding protein
MADYGYPSYGAMILASNTMIMKNPQIVQDFVDASIEGWIDYIYGDPSLGNNLILSENNEMTQEVLFQAIRKIREYNMISSEAPLRDDIGRMSEEKWKNFFKIMSENGVYDKDLEWRDAFTLDFIGKGN